jgi:hypothetical protein
MEILDSLKGLLESEAFANLLTVFILALLSAVIKLATSKIKSDKIANAVNWFGETVTSTVKSIQQTYVDSLKEAKADGKLTDEEKNAIKNLAIATVKKSLSDETYKLLSTVYADVEKKIADSIEAAVKDLHLASGQNK